MATEPEAKRSRIALFLDIENLIAGASTMGLPIEIEPVLQNLKTHGNIRVRKCFGDIHKCMHSVGRASETDRIRNMLHRNLVQIEDVPFVTAKKNTADIRLVIDALSLAYQYEDMTHFAVVASDRDYVPLFNKLHELGRTVIAVGIDRDNTNPMLLEASDILLYYETFFENLIEKTTGDEGDEDESVAAIEPLFEVLRQSLQTLANNGSLSVGSAVATSMRQLRSDFSPQLVGCESFKAFIQKAEAGGVVTVKWPDGPGDYTITLCPRKDLLSRAVVLQQPSSATGSQDIASHYRTLIESRLNVPLPNRQKRLAVLDALRDSYDSLMKNGPFPLREMSDAAIEKLRNSGKGSIPLQSVYKIALSLSFSRCFHCGEWTDKYNPTIVGQAVTDEQWEQRLYMAFVTAIRRRAPGERILATPLSSLLFESESEEDVKNTEQIIDEARWN